MKSFPLYDLPDLAMLNVLKTMDTIDLIRLNMANDKHMRNQFRKYVSLGRIVLTIGLLGTSNIEVGNFTWATFKTPFWNKKDSTPVSLKPMQYDAIDRTVSTNHTLWYTEHNNTEEVTLNIASWILKMFPKTVHSDIYFYRPSIATLDWFKPLDINKFKDVKIVASKDCDARITAFMNDAVRDRDVAVLSSAGGRNPLKIVHVKKLGKRRLPLERMHYFERFFLMDSFYQYIVMSGKGVTETHLQEIVKNWMTGVTPNLTFVQIKCIHGLEMTKIVKKRDMENWNDAEMKEYRTLTDFTEYFNETGIVIRSAGKKASIHVNDQAGTFTMVVWDTLRTNPNFNLHNQIAF